jgi:hypothetical protein
MDLTSRPIHSPLVALPRDARNSHTTLSSHRRLAANDSPAPVDLCDSRFGTFLRDSAPSFAIRHLAANASPTNKFLSRSLQR